MPRSEDIKQLIVLYNRRLQKLREHEALKGINAPPEILIEIEDIEQKLTGLQAELETASAQPASSLTDDELARELTRLSDDKPVPSSSTQVGGFNLSNVRGSTINIIGDVSANVSAGGDIVGGDNKASEQLPVPLYSPPSHQKFIGRIQDVDKLMSDLRKPGLLIKAIIGLGGIGKTALVQELVEHAMQEELFDYIVWVSFKTEYFQSERIISTDVLELNRDALLNDIGRQCNRSDILKMPPNEKLNAVKYLLANGKILVVIDNLETVPEYEKLIEDFARILEQSKLLITCRHHISKNDQVSNYPLSGMIEDEAIIFLREESNNRNIQNVIQAQRPHLLEIWEVSGGSPLAMKLVVGQMARQPMDVVLNRLQEAAFEDQDEKFYRFVYKTSWDMLDINAKTTLVIMSHFPPFTGGAVEDIKNLSKMERAVFWQAMDQLVTYSLVDKKGSIRRERYALHPLTQYFIKSDITKKWAKR